MTNYLLFHYKQLMFYKFFLCDRILIEKNDYSN